ncbi:MAG: hypothetical protein M3299_01020 [Thermoproteota archaeon]|nr:hypothetical protein [Thermoproteota archaeon]
MTSCFASWFSLLLKLTIVPWFRRLCKRENHLRRGLHCPVTIIIDNIIPGWDVASSIDDDDDPIFPGEGEEIRDSVTFTARVIPELPFFVMLPLVVGISLMIMAMRIRSSFILREAHKEAKHLCRPVH